VAVHEHTGLFVERAPKRYGFMHLKFEEYYAARYLIARQRLSARRIRQHLHQPRWEEPILLALGFVGLEYPADASTLAETAILARGDEARKLGFTPSPYEDLLGQDYLFALRCLGDSIPVRPSLLNQLLERMSDELLHHTGSARFERYRQALLERLAYLEGSAGASLLFPRLVSAPHDARTGVRMQAAWGLGQLGQASPEGVDELYEALQKASSTTIRLEAARLLGQIGRGDSATVDVLLSGLLDEDDEVRSACAQALARLGKRRTTMPPLIEEHLVQAIQDPQFGKPDRVRGRPAYD